MQEVEAGVRQYLLPWHVHHGRMLAIMVLSRKLAALRPKHRSAALLAAGIALNLEVDSMASDYGTYNAYTNQKESQRKNDETWGWVSNGAGAACLATGVLLDYLGLRSSADGSPSVAALPAGDGATLVVRGAL
jgi:hypothetical protein